MDLVYAATNGGKGQDFKTKQNGLRANALNKLVDGVLNREYKATLIDKGLNYFISVKLLILETIVSQRPWFKGGFWANFKESLLMK